MVIFSDLQLWDEWEGWQENISLQIMTWWRNDRKVQRVPPGAVSSDSFQKYYLYMNPIDEIKICTLDNLRISEPTPVADPDLRMSWNPE